MYPVPEVKTAFEREGLPVPPELLEQWGRDADIDYTEFLASLVAESGRLRPSGAAS